MSVLVKGLSVHQCGRECEKTAEHTMRLGQTGHILFQIFHKKELRGLLHIRGIQMWDLTRRHVI